MQDATWLSIERERLSLADLADGLTDKQWETQSLCTEWRVRDVIAHLVMTPAGEPGLGQMARAVLRTRGNVWGAGRDVSIAYAARSTVELAAGLRTYAAARTKPVFVNADNIVLDLFVHGQDIAIPLGLDRAVPSAAGVAALQRSWVMGWPFYPRRRLAGVRLVAEDGDWSAGDGPEVTGRIADLLLLTSNRTQAALDRLHGPGREVLRRRFRPQPVSRSSR